MRKQHHHIVSPEKLFLYTGVCVLFFVLLFLVLSSGETQTLTDLWIPLTMAGVALVLTFRFIK